MGDKIIRVDFIDQIRGLMILWMLVVHISLNYGYITYGVPLPRYSVFSWLSFFMVPFFFFSGYFFKKDAECKEFLVKKIKSLLLPYMVYALVGGGIYVVYKFATGEPARPGFVLSVIPSGMPFYNTPMWFFICLFSVNVFYYIITRFPSVLSHIVIALCFFIGWYIEGDNRTQILMHRPFFLAAVYFHIGYVFHNYFEEKLGKYAIIICLAIYVGINLLNQQCLWFVGDLLTQGNYLLNLMFSLAGTILLYLFFLTIKNKNLICNSLQRLGRFSLVVFASHRSILNYIYEPAIRHLWPQVSYTMFLTLGLVFLISMSYLLFHVMKRIHPALVGLK